MQPARTRDDERLVGAEDGARLRVGARQVAVHVHRRLEPAHGTSQILSVPSVPRLSSVVLSELKVREVISVPWALLDELEPGCLRSLWKASMARYVLDERRSLELFKNASIWDDFPTRPGQVFDFLGRSERYEQRPFDGGELRPRAKLEVDEQHRLQGQPGQALNPVLRPTAVSPELRTTRFKQRFFVPRLGDSAFGGGGGGGWGGGEAASGGGGAGGAFVLEDDTPLVYSLVQLPLIGPLDRWWEPTYSRLHVELCLTPVPSDAGADVLLLYPSDPTFDDGAEEDDATPQQQQQQQQQQGAGADSDSGDNQVDWHLWGKDDLPRGGLWPAPEPEANAVSPFSGGGRDFMRVAGPGVYVGCAYAAGPEGPDLREENFVYFALARRM
ncbi:hypothetical protein TSOC_004293 [Tetrabaena socialis]|uniref:Uncharacterized protein n=1 Tax=Tetrabaena socialis TaxID=47790 RepID=A0A2J8A9B5_9CHLO|nr:hypothetical protein TSOC_004293 [Tetrabaena socialis]|eukprot:PNH09124.1 hypothetical protein TSOC_004293 [Tetrabaena socialis]